MIRNRGSDLTNELVSDGKVSFASLVILKINTRECVGALPQSA